MTQVTGAEEEETFQIDVYIDKGIKNEFDSNDPFEEKISDGLRASLDASTKKRITRQMNTLEKRHAGADGTESKKVEDDIVTGYNIFEVVSPPYNQGYLAKLYEISAAHLAAVDAKVFNTVGLGYDFIETEETKQRIEKATTEKKAAKIRQEINDEKIRIRELLDNFNTEDDFMETLIKVVTDLETTGNGYLEIGRDVEGKIGYIGHIPSQSMRVRRKRDGFVQIISNKAVFFRNFGDTDYPNPLNNDPNPSEAIHFKIYTPTNGFYGVPKIVSAKVAVAGNEFAGKYNLDYFENKAVPRYVIVTKGSELSPSAKDQLFEFFTSGLKGVNHRSLYIPLPADTNERKVDFEMQPVEAGVQDASFTNYRKGNLADVLMAHRVPLGKVSTAENISLAQARDADKTFKEQVTRPNQSIYEKKINKIIKELTQKIKFKLNELALSDEDTQSQIDERYLRMQTYTPNEVRARKGLPGIEGGDKVVELKPQQAADQQATAGKTRARDSARSAGRTDSAGEGRNAKGDGRVTKFIKAEQPDFGDHVMIALKIPEDVAQQLAIDGGLEPDELHITLAYLGEIMEQEVGPMMLARLIADQWGAPLEGVISGKGLFVNDGETVTYLSPDIPGLPEYRQNIIRALKEIGADPAENHGFTPHITLSYGDELGRVNVQNVELEFEFVSLYWGTTRIDIPLEPLEAFDGLVD